MPQTQTQPTSKRRNRYQYASLDWKTDYSVFQKTPQEREKLKLMKKQAVIVKMTVKSPDHGK